MSEFARRLKASREELKRENSMWTQSYVAKKIGVARSTYTAYENDTKQPPIDTINAIADLFGKSTDYLLGRVKNKIINNELDEDYEEFEKFFSDPNNRIHFREMAESPEEMREKLWEYWDLLKKANKKV